MSHNYELFGKGNVMNLEKELLNRVENGERFNIDFKNRNLKVGKEYLIKNGNVKSGYTVECPCITLEELEELYEKYYYSRPSERSERNQHTYFKALDYEDLTDEQLITGLQRELARARLECTLLEAILGGFEWKENYGKWYWKSEKFPSFVILKDWIMEA